MMSNIRQDLRELIAKHGVQAVYAELQLEMKETFDFLRQVYDPPKNNLVIPLGGVIPDRIATPLHKPMSVVMPVEPPQLELSQEEEDDLIQGVQEPREVSVSVSPDGASLKEVVIQAKSEMNRQMGEKFSKAKHREDVAKKYKEISEKGVKPESLLTKENLTKWLGEGMSYMRIAREQTGVHENEIAAIAKTFGLQSDVKKYIVMRRGGK